MSGKEGRPSTRPAEKDWSSILGDFEDSGGRSSALSPGGRKAAGAFIYTYMSVFGLELSLEGREVNPQVL